jgi:hypothetical protein
MKSIRQNLKEEKEKKEEKKKDMKRIRGPTESPKQTAGNFHAHKCLGICYETVNILGKPTSC